MADDRELLDQLERVLEKARVVAPHWEEFDGDSCWYCELWRPELPELPPRVTRRD